MCTSCFTQLDAMFVQAGVGGAVLTNAVRRWRDRRHGIGRLERDQRTWIRTAERARELGFADPTDMVGAAPGHPVEVPSTRRHSEAVSSTTAP